jgi:hemerythrin superfamily protein
MTLRTPVKFFLCANQNGQAGLQLRRPVPAWVLLAIWSKPSVRGAGPGGGPPWNVKMRRWRRLAVQHGTMTAPLSGDTGIFATLQQEHGKVSALMSELARTRADDDDRDGARRNLYAQIRSELVSHTAAEETTFYARLKAHPETSSLIDESIDEHQKVEDLLEELDRLQTDSLIFDSRFKDLMAAVEHHVEEEETELFPAARNVLTSEEVADLDEAFKAQKQAQLRS